MNLADIRINILSGLTVALAMVPEVIAFALLAHLSPLTGLQTASVLGFITAIWGGRSGMISGAAGALAVVSVALIEQHGNEYLFATVILMGLLQVLFGVARLGKFIRMVPHSVMLGFVNGLAIVIFIAQFTHLKTTNAEGHATWMATPELLTTAGLVALTVGIIEVFPRITRLIPASLVGIAITSTLVATFSISTRTVGDQSAILGGLPQFHLPDVPLTWETLHIITPYAFILAAIGLIESLLTLNLIDEMTNTRGQPNRESLALGAANTLTGFLSGMGGCAMIGQSIINMNSGGRQRLSGITTAFFLMVFVLFASTWIERIPLAALIGVMFVMARKTFAWGSLQTLHKIPKADALVVMIVTSVTVLTDLATAVFLGIVISALVFAWNQARHIRASIQLNEQNQKKYFIEGPLFFASTTTFSELFTPATDPNTVIVDFQHCKVMDHSGINAIDALAERYRAQGKTLRLRHLSADCLALLDKAQSLIEIDPIQDPRYHIADDQLD